MSLRTARTGQMLYPAGFFDLAFEDVQQYDIDGVTVTQRQNAGRITGISWAREGYEYLLYSLARPAPTGLQIFYPTASSSRRRRRMMRFSSREI